MSGSFRSPISPPDPGATHTSPVTVLILTMPSLYLFSKISTSSSCTLLLIASVLSSFCEQAKALVMSKYKLRCGKPALCNFQLAISCTAMASSLLLPGRQPCSQLALACAPFVSRW
eukprot:2622515-Heterocapsa_arctica.AAC.1